MTYEEKVAYAHRVTEHALATSKNPAFLCSFGKDSMVLLHILEQHRRLPIVFFKHPFHHHKYRFANSVIENMGLQVYDYAPAYVEAHENGDNIGFLSHYQAGNKTLMVGCGINKDPGGICALENIYLRPNGSFSFPWDLVFVGHKSSDVDPIVGPVPLNSDFVNGVNFPSIAYPIRYFTDEDIWTYTNENGVPVHTERYIDNDVSANPDYVTACTACMSRNGPASVPCPKRGGMPVANVSNQLRWAGTLDLAHMRT